MYLHTPTVQRIGKPRLVSFLELPGLTGFRSVFGYPPKTASIIRAQGNTKNLQRHSVHANELLVDFDNAREAAEALKAYLVSHGISYTMYDSGNRSVHFHVPIVSLTDPDVPHSLKSWVIEHAPEADLTIYRHSSLFRLVNTIHEKNPDGKKVMMESHRGRRLRIPLIKRAKIVDTAPVKNEHKLERALNIPQHEGNRRVHAWTIANFARKAGFNEDEAYWMLRQWNEKKATPRLKEEVLWQKLSEAYRQDLI
jgi:hypothetical protein